MPIQYKVWIRTFPVNKATTLKQALQVMLIAIGVSVYLTNYQLRVPTAHKAGLYLHCLLKELVLTTGNDSCITTPRATALNSKSLNFDISPFDTSFHAHTLYWTKLESFNATSAELKIFLFYLFSPFFLVEKGDESAWVESAFPVDALCGLWKNFGMGLLSRAVSFS